MENMNENTPDIETLKQQVKDLETELFRTKAESEINTAIAMARPRSLAAAKVMLDKEGIITENGIGKEALDKNIAKLREENPWLFESTKADTKLYSSGLNWEFGASSDPSSLSDDEYYKRIMK